METNNAYYSEVILNQLKISQAYIETLEKYTTEEVIKKTVEQLKQEAKKLWDQAKQVLDEN